MFDLEQLLQQNKNFLGQIPKRSEVLKTLRTPVDISKSLSFEVIRSMPFEFITDSLNCFLKFEKLSASFNYSSYDPALSSVYSLNDRTDGVILWIDWRLHKSMSYDDLYTWLISLFKEVRKKTDVPIIINNWLFNNHELLRYQSLAVSSEKWVIDTNVAILNAANSFPGIYIVDMETILGNSSFKIWDTRNDSQSAFPFSDQSAIALGRFLANSVILNLIKSRIKAIIVDLDNTLYNGVLGEGLETLIINENHKKFHRALKNLAASGVLLALCSKNELKDVQDFFSREIIELSLQDFTSIKVSWNSKEQAVSEILDEFNFSDSYAIFIDDNPTELVQVKGVHPNITLIQADPIASFTLEQLKNSPRVYQLSQDDSAEKRMADIKANQERKKIEGSATGHGEYLRLLGMEVGLYHNFSSHIGRVHALSNKTNQFNLTFSRFSESKVEELAQDPNHTFTITLKDRFADSGIIGAFIFSAKDDAFEMIEVLYSCRALGRDIEYLSFLEILRFLRKEKKVIIAHKVVGERNTPAINWFDAIFKTEGEHQIETLIQSLESKLDEKIIKLTWRSDNAE